MPANFPELVIFQGCFKRDRDRDPEGSDGLPWPDEKLSEGYRQPLADVGRAAVAILAAVRSRKQQGAMRRCLRPTDISMRAQFRAFPLLDESLSNWSIGKRGHSRGRITGPMQRGFDLAEYYFRSITFYSTRAPY